MKRDDDIETRQLESVKMMVRDHQTVFGTPQGKRVLCDFLVKNYFFSTCRNDEERIRRNVAVELLQSAGILHADTLRPLTDGLVSMGMTYPLVKDGRA